MQWFIMCIYLYIVVLLNVNVRLPHCLMEESVIKHSYVHIFRPSPDLTQNKSFVAVSYHTSFFSHLVAPRIVNCAHISIWSNTSDNEGTVLKFCIKILIRKATGYGAVWQGPNSWQKQKYQIGSEACPVSYPVGMEDSFPDWKLPEWGADNSPTVLMWRICELYLHFTKHLQVWCF
jgi:hypothetical protein